MDPTKRARTGSGDSGPHDAAAAAQTWLSRGCGALAAAAFDTALQRLATGPGAAADQAAQEALRRAWLAGQAEALTMAGERERARVLLAAHFDPRLRDTAVRLDAADVRARVTQARLHMLARDPAGAEALARATLARLRSARGALREGRARLHGVLAVALGMQGRLAEALAAHDAALAAFDRESRTDLQRDLGSELANRGGTLWKLGRAAEAEAGLRRARAILCGLLDQGAERDRQFVAIVEANLAAVCIDLGQGDEALALYRCAAARLDRVLRRRSASADLPRARASRAAVAMNLAFLLFRQQAFDAAAREFRAARRRYAALKMAAPQLAEDEARTWVNQAHLQAARGQAQAARRLYARGHRQLQRQAEGGATHLVADIANAQFGLARCLLVLGRPGPAVAHFGQAQARLVGLTQQGQLQHARPWAEALVAMADAWRGSACTSTEPAAALRAALAQPARCSQHDAAAQLRDIEAGLAHLARWQGAGPQPPAWPVFTAAWLGLLLDRSALLLGDTDPEALRALGTATAPVVARLGEAAAAMPDPAPALAEWFLRTKGLRAQRSALAQGNEPALRRLREQLARLRRLEEDLLAAPASAAQGQHWRTLHERCEQARQALVRSGRLPPTPQLQALTLAQALGPAQALLLLSRTSPRRLLLIVLCRPGGGPWARVQPIELPADAPDGIGANRAWRQALLAGTPGQALRRAADSDSLDTQPLPSPEQARALAQRLHQPLLEQGFAPLLHTLAQEGRHALALVASADLHLLPLHHLLAGLLARCGSRLALYPSCGAWALCRQTEPARQRGRPHLRWALLAQGLLNGPAPLHWVELERRLSQRLWEQAPPQLLDPAAPRARGVDALIGMGHGDAPQGNLARAGLLTAPGQVLSAHELPQIRHCRRLLLSCCVLGRVDEVHAETMGFLSAAFGYRVCFGVGWLVEVPDAEACLFSLALQHALRQAQRRRGRLCWGEVFTQTRSGIAGAAWPSGFGAWLQETLPAALATAALPPGRWLNRYEYLRDFDGGLFEQPPPSLQRLMPWVTALGE